MRDGFSPWAIALFLLAASAGPTFAGEKSDRLLPAPTQQATTTVADAGDDDGFSLATARDYILQAGYSGVTDLERVNDLVWRGTASKDGVAYSVAVDYTGTVVGAN